MLPLKLQPKEEKTAVTQQNFARPPAISVH